MFFRRKKSISSMPWKSSYHARDQCQGAAVIPDGDKIVTSGQIPGEADVSCNILSRVDSAVGLAFAVDSGLKIGVKTDVILMPFCSFYLRKHV